MSTGEAGPSGAHEIRITNHGKIASWVTFALEHLNKHEDKPLVFHTLPAAKGKAPAPAEEVAVAGPDGESGKEKKREGLHPSMSTIPRLISVVEIIKREYLKTLDPSLAEAGRLSGLHQYNEIGDLEDAGFAERTGDEEQERIESLARALQGRNHAKQKRIAFMRVTLSRREIPQLVGKGATYQPPAVRKLSRSARARLKSKNRAAAEGR
ncbi:hypothetical protein C8Q77DRAFT_1051699 [Trametes polyzona]|nr:hypothetical protein C8Q77DRAFT_1051699 [Trametes polyzona]